MCHGFMAHVRWFVKIKARVLVGNIQINSDIPRTHFDILQITRES